MKIGINGLFLQTPASGSGQYLLHLLKELPEVDQHNDYLLLGAQPLARDQQLPFPYRVHAAPSFTARNENVAKLAWEQFTGPAAARRARVDLLHVPYFAPPLFPRTPTVVTIHDVIPLRLPAYRAGAKVEAYMRLVAQAAHRATLIITVSQHAKRDMVDALHLPAERIRVTYEAAGEQYRPITDRTRLAQARARYGLGECYIFYLGGLDQRKNVPQLVRAFAHLYKQLDLPDLQLFISGDPDRQKGPLFPDPRPVAADLGVADHVICRFVTDEDKPAVYSGASLYVFPSLYEGFGLDPLEAMSCGAPVVCSNRTSLPEVVGDAALSVDPADTRGLVEAMRSVITDSALADDLRERALRRAAQFNWRKTAGETLAVYEEAVARHKH
jgi:glycosyltransferase involved in cell wall biosynthesis